MQARTDEAALQAVITYKALKGVVQLLLALALSLSLLFGGGQELREWAHEFRNHSTRAYAVEVSRALEKATTPRGLHITLAALWLDGVVTLLEGWALRRRHWWGPWVVVGVSGALLPFEIFELARRFRWTRLLVLVVNGAVVAFLIVHARALSRRATAESSSRGPGEPPAATAAPKPGAPLHPDG
jgi:uncharacterized membrane protein (DUF2068 family)